MIETTIEERLADIRNIADSGDPNTYRYISDFVDDIANAVSQLADVVKEINDRAKTPMCVVAIDPAKHVATPLADVAEGTEVEKLHRKIFDIEVREDLVIADLGQQIKTLKTELDIVIQIGHNLKAERDALAEVNDTQSYVIRNRVNSFSEGVFAKALEDDMADMETDIEGLDAELATRRDEAKALWKVVEIAKDWNDSMMVMRDSIGSMEIVYNVVEEYIDISENAPEITVEQTVDTILRTDFINKVTTR